MFLLLFGLAASTRVSLKELKALNEKLEILTKKKDQEAASFIKDFAKSREDNSLTYSIRTQSGRQNTGADKAAFNLTAENYFIYKSKESGKNVKMEFDIILNRRAKLKKIAFEKLSNSIPCQFSKADLLYYPEAKKKKTLSFVNGELVFKNKFKQDQFSLILYAQESCPHITFGKLLFEEK
ncbi:hypothetical protein TRFO_31092 [Tritrichomonas foetus]|uniref:Uncharacterized protein n=1 Tax=Tritrichomonas foetus TaxID=1144522 RepID=A0A1J4JWP5_9EUKA|nr:hypothetical protein TRFO_31092 [Tritrichomonas foetus]|eukprot:OHT01956.1 hypothetical protein TRFO_31092 [Tritrichomonas foetus]